MTETQIRIINSIQDGLPLSRDPFAEIANEVGISEEQLLAQLNAWKAGGTIRRFGAILHHHQAGYSVNAMGIWNAPDEQVEEFGRTAASARAVSHCYERPRFGGFRYNVYTMIHGRSRKECESAAKEISAETGITDYRLLYTTAEFKKTSPSYFAEE